MWTIDNHIYRWHDGEATWTLIESGMPQGFTYGSIPIIVDDGSGPRLCVRINNGSSPALMVWSGSAWEERWPGILSDLAPVTSGFCSGDLGGGWSLYGVVTVNYPQTAVARWTVDHWEVLGSPGNDSVEGATILTTRLGTRLYAWGAFAAAPGRDFVVWNGQGWETAGDQAFAAIGRADSFDDGSGLAAYAFANFGQSIPEFNRNGGLARFDGEHWTMVGQYNPPTGFYVVKGNLIFNDGRGPAIYLWGSFDNFGGVAVHNVARYGLLDHTWSGLGDGLRSGSPEFMAVMPTRRGPSLFALGSFTVAGGGTVNHTAQYVGCPNCYANCDLSTTPPRLNVNDFMCFLARFARNAPEANCDNNATIDVSDFVCFLGRFGAGCP